MLINSKKLKNTREKPSFIGFNFKKSTIFQNFGRRFLISAYFSTRPIDLFNMCAAAFKITSQKAGETLSNFTLGQNWLVMADRTYGSLTSIEHCLQAQANFILRLKYAAFKLYNEDGSEFNLLENLPSI